MYYEYFIWCVSCTRVNFTCFCSICVCVCVCVCVRERERERDNFCNMYCTYILCAPFVYLFLLFCAIFIFVCISVGLLPPGESPTALSFVWPRVWWRQCCYNTAYGACVCPSLAATLGQTHTWFIYIYIYICVCVCVCVSSTRIWNFTCCLHAGLSMFTFLHFTCFTFYAHMIYMLPGSYMVNTRDAVSLYKEWQLRGLSRVKILPGVLEKWQTWWWLDDSKPKLLAILYN
jgi:hypothetical protein